MKEIGGYFELELHHDEEYYPDFIHLNSSRNCLRYLIRAKKIQKIWVPAYTCPVVWAALEDENCRFAFYELGPDFLPTKKLPQDEYILYTNYFGVCNHQAARMKENYPYLILDNSQAFYGPHFGGDAFYSPRKFFGLPDGGLLHTDCAWTTELEQDSSMNRISHLVKRIETGASSAYQDFRQNDESLDHVPVMAMSKLTQRLLRNIPYQACAEQRQKNFAYLHQQLGGKNKLVLHELNDSVPMVYPYLPGDIGAEQKKKLIAHQIYVATYWPGQKDSGFGNILESHLLALPIDQRYTEKDMEYMLEVLNE